MLDSFDVAVVRLPVSPLSCPWGPRNTGSTFWELTELPNSENQKFRQLRQTVLTFPEAPVAFNGRPDPCIRHPGGVWGSQNLAV